MEVLELRGALPELGRARYLGEMSRNRKLCWRLSCIAIFLALAALLIGAWWAQTAVVIGALGNEFDAQEIIRKVEIESDARVVSGTLNLFRMIHPRRISKIILKPSKILVDPRGAGERFNSVIVHVFIWRNGHPDERLMYYCRFDQEGVLTMRRLYEEGTR